MITHINKNYTLDESNSLKFESNKKAVDDLISYKIIENQEMGQNFCDYLENNRLKFAKILKEDNKEFISDQYENINFIARKKDDTVRYFIDLNHIIGTGKSKVVRDYYNYEKGKSLVLYDLSQAKPELVKLAKKEFKILTRMKNINLSSILRVKFWGELNTNGVSKPFMMAEKCDGNLETLFKEKLSEAQKIDLIKQLILGLAIIHKMGYIHRDIKPDNILYTKDKEGNFILKFADFGFACKREWKEKYGLLGSPLYFSPEFCKVLAHKLKSEEINHSKVDVWALGTTLHRLYKGVNLKFIQVGEKGRVPYSVWVRHLAKLAVISGLDSNNPMESIIQKMLDCDFEKRISAKQALKQFSPHLKELTMDSLNLLPPVAGFLNKKSVQKND